MRQYKKISLICYAGIILLSSGSVQAQDKQFHFERISLDQGLSQSTVNCITQDKKGFMWFGTQDGLNRYDGYEFKVYKHNPNDPNSLSNNQIYALCEDKEGFLWIGTGDGLNKYNPALERYEVFKNDDQNTNSISNNHIRSILEDSSGFIWVGTNGGGLNKYNKNTGNFIRYDSTNYQSLSNDFVNTIYEDRRGALWVGTFRGFNKYDPSKDIFLKYLDDIYWKVHAFHEDKAGNFWIGTNYDLRKFDRNNETYTIVVSPEPIPVNSILEDQNGIFWVPAPALLRIFDQESNKFTRIPNISNDPSSISDNWIKSIYEDRSGMVWIGTKAGGLNKYDPYKEPFTLFRHDPNNPNSLSDNIVRSLCEDKQGNLWIATQLGGLNKLVRPDGDGTESKNNVFTHFKFPEIANSNVLWSVLEDRFGMIWIGTRWDGVIKLNPFTGDYTHHRFKTTGSTISIENMYEDRQGNIWIGTNVGLCKYDRANDTFIWYKYNENNPGSLSDNHVFSLLEDSSGVLWVGTSNGLNKLIPAGLSAGSQDIENDGKDSTATFTRYYHQSADPESISLNQISSIHEDQEGTIWIGTYGGGLNKYNPNTDNFTHYTGEDGLANDIIYGILDDDSGNLWISTNQGISKFNPHTLFIVNFDERNLLQGLEFNRGAFHKSSSGEMFFGGINGFNAFFPEQIKNNPSKPQILITDLKIFNKSVTIGENDAGRTILNTNITATKDLTLDYNENVFTLELVALHYADPESNQYAYMIEELDKDWNYIGASRFVPFSHLAPGEYTVRIKGANGDGLWNEEGTSIKITITPPWWQSTWFRSLAGIFTLGFIVTLFYWRTHSLRKGKEVLEKQVEERTIELQTTLELRLKAEKSLKLTQYAMDKSADPIYLVNPNNSGILYANESAVNEIGYSISEIKELKVSQIDLNLPVEEWTKFLETLKASGSMKFETKLRNKNNTIFPVELFVSYLTFDDKDYILAIARNISERKKSEKALKKSHDEINQALKKLKETQTQLVQVEKMASLGQLTAGIAHEINNPVNFVNAGSIGLANDLKELMQLLEKYEELGNAKDIIKLKEEINALKTSIDYDFIKDNLPKTLEDIITGAKRITEIVKGLSSFSRIDTEAQIMADIHEGLDSSLTLLQHELKNKVTVTKDYDNTIEAIPCYPGQLNQVFMNILRNAIDSIDDKGEIIIKTKMLEGKIEISIKDNGSGMNEAVKTKIFDPFFTTKDVGKGTGLGLAISYGIIEKQRGKIEVESEVGKGSEFVIELPIK